MKIGDYLMWDCLQTVMIYTYIYLVISKVFIEADEYFMDLGTNVKK